MNNPNPSYPNPSYPNLNNPDPSNPDQVCERLAAEERILVGGAYTGPGGRNPWGEAGKSIRFVTHLQTPRAAVRALLAGLAKHLRHV